MSLKRKASYPTITSSPGPIATITIDESPKHLHSRTRKRFRNDRPSDETVYENTLRWIYSAQRHQQQITAESANDEEINLASVPSPVTVDPQQQSILKFFRCVERSRSQSLTPSLDDHGSKGNSSPNKSTSWTTQESAPSIPKAVGTVMQLDIEYHDGAV